MNGFECSTCRNGCRGQPQQMNHFKHSEGIWTWVKCSQRRGNLISLSQFWSLVMEQFDSSLIQDFALRKWNLTWKQQCQGFVKPLLYKSFFGFKVIYESIYSKWQPINVLFAVRIQKLQKCRINEEAFIIPENWSALLSHYKSIYQVCSEQAYYYSIKVSSETVIFWCSQFSQSCRNSNPVMDLVFTEMRCLQDIWICDQTLCHIKHSHKRRGQ